MSYSSEIRLAVVGTGSWGTAASALAGVDPPTTLRMSRSNESDLG